MVNLSSLLHSLVSKQSAPAIYCRHPGRNFLRPLVKNRMVQDSGTRLAGVPCPLATQTRWSSIFAQRLCCPELGRSCLQLSRLQECFDTRCFLREDPIWYYGCLLHCSVLNWCWRAARRPLVLLKLDIPPRHGQKATCSGVDFFQKQLPPPKACQNLFHAPGRHFSLLGISVLLSITPAT